jgi:hypothetical protein
VNLKTHNRRLHTAQTAREGAITIIRSGRVHDPATRESALWGSLGWLEGDSRPQTPRGTPCVEKIDGVPPHARGDIPPSFPALEILAKPLAHARGDTASHRTQRPVCPHPLGRSGLRAIVENVLCRAPLGGFPVGNRKFPNFGKNPRFSTSFSTAGKYCRNLMKHRKSPILG